ncbi:hypothetical protein AMAG_20605 [Allomyces macrogynus ATCC 38327]|uniref:Erythromycin biosynthesis protein CIII-like C-terminal domain-containing protein n=1 Tax=Allomyces macrogynus (strain ATCC 38327) TaxID=578462 RepID=A0A0L0TD05_ALLM3|nr:hypothetical protein AMAG_20605 [Allomyces macrogynus ATCC 38327]|eukprot:KNE72555.1 hypothetical protein AMAG_20605 [Allomyces macrogynus ATCC 38327]
MRAFVNNDFTDSDALFGRSDFTDIATQLVAVASSFDVVLVVGYLLAHHAVVLRQVAPATTVVGVEMFLMTYPTRTFPPAIPALPAIPNLAGWINRALHHFNNFMGYKIPKDAAEPLDPSLAAWLDAGTKPVYVGFGVVTVDAFDLVALLRDLLAHVPSSTRVVVFAGGYSATGAVPFPTQVAALQALDSDRVFVISTTASHALLFPRCKAIVHHAGAGTIAAAARAGVPQVPVPVAIDQPYWAQRVFELGVAARPVPFAKRSGARIAAGIKEAREEGMVKRAREVAEMSRREPEGAGVLATWVAGLVSAAQPSVMEGGVEKDA